MQKVLTLSIAFIIAIILLLFWLVSNGIRTPHNTTLANGAKLEWGECWFDTEWHKPVHCGWLSTVPAEKGGKSAYQLPVVVMQRSIWGKSNDPILYLAGGPGSASWLDSRGIDYWKYWFETRQLKRDLVFFDQRGVGLSKPRFGCSEFIQLGQEILLEPVPPDENAARYLEAAQQCYTRLKEENQPLQELGTNFSALDVNSLMQLMDYNAWNVYGVSYGTRLAMEVQRRYPHQVRTVLLDSVYPPHKNLFLSWPGLLHESIARIITWCENDIGCREGHLDGKEKPQMRLMIWELLERLREQPVRVPVGQRDDFPHSYIMVNDEILLSILFDAQYLQDSLTYIAKALFDLYIDNNIQNLKPLVENYLDFQFDKDFSDAVFWSVECHDSVSNYAEQLKIEIARYPRLAHYLQDDKTVCDVWDVGKITDDFHQPVSSDIPTLIFSGEDDPITPPAWAAEALDGYIHGHFFRFLNTSHSVLDSKACGVELYRKFLDDPFNRPSANCR